MTQFLIVLAESIYYGLLTNFITQYVTIITPHVVSSQQKWLNKQHTVCLVPLSLNHYLEKQSVGCNALLGDHFQLWMNTHVGALVSNYSSRLVMLLSDFLLFLVTHLIFQNYSVK